MPKITISQEGKSPQSYRFDDQKESVSIGRGSDNDITISCESVSTKHCHISKTESGYTLYDDDSTNGIKSDGKKAKSIDLTDGLEVLIGDTPLTFHMNSESSKTEDTVENTEPAPEETPTEAQPDTETKNPMKKWFVPVFILGLLALAGVAYLPFWGEVGMASPDAETSLGKWLAFLGDFHPVFLHLPIGAVLLVLVMEICRLFTAGKYQPRTTLALSFAAVTTVFAVVFGYFLYLSGDYTTDLAEEHKDEGIIFSLLVIVTFLVKYFADAFPKKKAAKPLYIVCLLATSWMLVMAAHKGGEMTHGDLFANYPGNAEGDDTTDVVITDPIVYKNIVHPILEQKCISCHGEKKQKSGLRMDSYAALLEGGDEEEALVPGNLEESMMIAYLHLPLDDDLRMPPKEKTQLTTEEIQILEWWVKIGAPEKALLSEVEVTPVIAKAIDSLKTPEELAREKAAREKAEKERAAAQKKKRAELEATINTVNKEFPGSLKYISQEDTSLVFSAVSYRSQFEDSNLDVLAAAGDSLKELNLGATKLTDAGVQKLAVHSGIEVLKLSETAITDASIEDLSGLKNLRVLNVYGTAVTDAGIKALHGHPTLKKIYLWQTKVTPDGAKALEKSLHDAQPKAVQDEAGNEVPVPAAQVILGS